MAIPDFEILTPEDEAQVLQELEEYRQRMADETHALRVAALQPIKDFLDSEAYATAVATLTDLLAQFETDPDASLWLSPPLFSLRNLATNHGNAVQAPVVDLV